MDAEQLRLERIADAEGTGRLANEQLVATGGQGWGSAEAAFRCECGNDICHEPLVVPREVYERVRGDSMLFIVRPGHEVPDAEDIVETGDGFQIVRKREGVRGIVEGSDPRNDG